jgi:hypothetical protein
MRSGLFRIALVVGFAMLAYAPRAHACQVCNVRPTSTTINGNTYFYNTGGCENPPNDSWGNVDCHTQYYVDPELQIQMTVECDTSGSACYYIEVTGGPGGTGGNDDEQSGGTGTSCPRDAATGACPAYCASC